MLNRIYVMGIFLVLNRPVYAVKVSLISVEIFQGRILSHFEKFLRKHTCDVAPARHMYVYKRIMRFNNDMRQNLNALYMHLILRY